MKSQNNRGDHSHNYQGVDLYTGKVFTSIKRTALYQPGTNHHADITKGGPIINPRIPDRFGRYFNVDELLEKWCCYSLRDEDGWHLPTPYSFLYHDVEYLGPLPKEGEILVVANHLIKIAEHQQEYQEVYYQCKHINAITYVERRIGNDPLVNADYTSDYKNKERCPEEPPTPSYKEKLEMLYGLQERWEHLSRLEEAGELDGDEDDEEDDADCNGFETDEDDDE
jgi:hypothetical protein